MEMTPNAPPMLMHFSIVLLTMTAVFYSVGVILPR